MEKSLLANVKVPNELEKFFVNYKIHVVELAWLSDDELKLLSGDLRNLAEQLIEKRVTGKFKRTDYPIQHKEQFLDLLSTLTSDNSLQKAFQETTKKQGEVTMKTCFEILKEEARIDFENERTHMNQEFERLNQEIEKYQSESAKYQSESVKKQDLIDRIQHLLNMGDFNAAQQLLAKENR